MKITFADLFAGIGGMRLAFEQSGASCVFSSELDAFACKTYKANFNEMPAGDITHIAVDDIPYHDILLAGFPCQPFSIAGVTKRNSLRRPHGLADKEQGNLFLEIVRVLRGVAPRAFLLENVSHLIHHDKGETFRIICEALCELGYDYHFSVISAHHYVPQGRRRIFIAGFRRGLGIWGEFKFPAPPSRRMYSLPDILDPGVCGKYTLTDPMWEYLQAYKTKHSLAGNGFGFSLVKVCAMSITRTLSARYGKDGSEILINQPPANPRRLSPRECARLMGFPDTFAIPVSDTQAYKQFGNSVVVPVVKAIADQMILLLSGSMAAGQPYVTMNYEKQPRLL